MTCLELTTFSQNSPNGYSDYPNFPTDIWSLFLRDKEFVHKVFEIIEPAFWKMCPEGNKFKVNELGLFHSLALAELNSLKEKSHYGSHMAVYYQVVGFNKIGELVKMWPSKRVVPFDKNNVRVDDSKLIIISELVGRLASNEALVSFAHDADPAYVFASEQTIGALAEKLQ